MLLLELNLSNDTTYIQLSSLGNFIQHFKPTAMFLSQLMSAVGSLADVFRFEHLGHTFITRPLCLQRIVSSSIFDITLH